MLRTRDILTIVIPAALLALAVQPMIESASAAYGGGVTVAPKADRLVGGLAAREGVVSVEPAGPGTVRVTPRTAESRPIESREAEERRAVQSPPPAPPTVRPRMRVGCEGAISALAGQEARRLLPSRCLA